MREDYGGRTIRRRTIRRGRFVADNSSRGQFVARQFVAGQFVACISDRNIIKKEREREKLIDGEKSLAETKRILLKKRKRKIQREREKVFYLHRHIRSDTFQVLT